MSGFPIVVDTDNTLDESDVAVAPNVIDVGGGGECPCNFMFTITALDSSGTRWRVQFSQPMELNPVLEWAGAYFLFESDLLDQPIINGHEPAVLAVEPEAVADPTYVDLTTEEHQQNTHYTLRLYSMEVA